MRLKHIELNVGKACNNRCLFCMSNKPSKEMLKLVSYDIIKGKIEDYYKEGYRSIGFLGGDISIHPKILDIIKISKNIGYKKINIITNAMLFDDYDFAKNIIKAGTTRINISIHSHLNNIEDYLTKVKGGLNRKIKAIDNFNNLYDKGLLKSPLSINIVVNKINYKSIIETVLFYFKIKQIRDIRINFIWLSEDIKDNWNKLKISYSEFLPYLKKLIYISLKYNFRLTFDTIPPCIFYKIDNKNYNKLIKKFLGEQFDFIDQIEHTNTNDPSEKFKWKDRKKDILKTQFRQCNKCTYNNICEGVRKEYSKIYGGKEFNPIYGKIDLKYYYNEIDNGKLENIEEEIIDLYFKNKDERFFNLYSVFLSKKGEHNKANNILLKLLNSKIEIVEKGNIYFNIAVNYINLQEKKRAEKYLLKAMELVGDKKNVKEFYDNFYGNKKEYNFYFNKKEYNLDDFKDKIIEFYNIKDENIIKKYDYINNLIDNLK